MHSSYHDGFTEAMMRHLPDEPYRPFTSTITYDPRETDYGWDLRYAWAGSYRCTLVSCETRGVLLLDELHVPLATELAAAFRRLEDIERIMRTQLPADVADTALLRTAVVVYADDWDVLPTDPRVQVVQDELRPSTTLRPLFERLLGSLADPQDVEHLTAAIYGTWDCVSRHHWRVDSPEPSAA